MSTMNRHIIFISDDSDTSEDNTDRPAQFIPSTSVLNTSTDDSSDSDSDGPAPAKIQKLPRLIQSMSTLKTSIDDSSDSDSDGPVPAKIQKLPRLIQSMSTLKTSKDDSSNSDSDGPPPAKIQKLPRLIQSMSTLKTSKDDSSDSDSDGHAQNLTPLQSTSGLDTKIMASSSTAYKDGMYPSQSSLPLDEMREKLKCPVCLALFKEPHILPCSHSFCRICLENMYSSRQNALQCPTCRQRLRISKDQLTLNLALENAVIHFKQTSEEKEKSNLKKDMCRDHSLEGMTVFCETCHETCQIWVCHLCLCEEVGRHIGHKVTTIEKVYIRMEESLKSKMTELDTLKNNAEEKYQSFINLTEQYQQKHMEMIEDEYELLHLQETCEQIEGFRDENDMII